MSKLATIRQALESNADVVIVDVIEENYLPDRNGYWSHTVNFWVAPRNGLYTPEALDEFMLGLVPELQPTEKYAFGQYGNTFGFGKLYFYEKIGEEKITRLCSLTDQEFFNSNGFVDGKKTIHESADYNRGIWVKPFPSEAVARDGLEGKLPSESYMYLENLKGYQPNLLQRIMGRR